MQPTSPRITPAMITSGLAHLDQTENTKERFVENAVPDATLQQSQNFLTRLTDLFLEYFGHLLDYYPPQSYSDHQKNLLRIKETRAALDPGVAVMAKALIKAAISPKPEFGGIVGRFEIGQEKFLFRLQEIAGSTHLLVRYDTPSAYVNSRYDEPMENDPSVVQASTIKFPDISIDDFAINLAGAEFAGLEPENISLLNGSNADSQELDLYISNQARETKAFQKSLANETENDAEVAGNFREYDRTVANELLLLEADYCKAFGEHPYYQKSDDEYYESEILVKSDEELPESDDDSTGSEISLSLQLSSSDKLP